ncbi:hypothetical protein WR164_04190 [Philodulcilactobacillus myokoensis]|uniref:Uncharacterized protein n=1 Tax=Philodulcilactobacillus myokoensis TaxID=2929573 RepID=A0A9W6B0T6_9LACO|nr:hypothetical protein [Philodulcilactobacillus myokoensis]GLB46440.1 hypothetical protein WR164_04190 [Philodulcilactobacillus myokoensis]
MSRRHNSHIIEVSDAHISEDVLAKPAYQVSKPDLKKLLAQSQYKSENQGIYIAKYSSHHENDDTYDAIGTYDDYLDQSMNDYLKHFDNTREAAKKHFHQEMTVRYFIDEYIALLHRKFENHQDPDSLVMITAYEKEID